ncbi:MULTISPECIES: hypothetical protein [Mucilaginibacter]|jgi:hypothetical protein|uniref:Uncharacterized protein n=3 Tax=Mucilaginibacter TaxID=423349 RepID=A0AAE6MLB7_9SPHI|nr:MULTISPECIES: hypothetical protein [Mucilaginibacter]NVM63861.1 hypothetical protein [Mucilaginibacter sp. SG538B]QEM07683.1 hypothetical protein DIU31_030840 [Mucilaginibacter rubeus]QEM20137.1 hypothetical protein DIU38_030445 [Mucilaginibacter gossypii]QTE34852.1 hypothetical protein J3L18_17020 [Mucilaginibacter gossypii]QTE43150.1 hypothetical protein J3L19_30215 [Mucilaginibacter rubeus]
MESMENANAEGHYKLLTVAIVIGIVGVFLRFAGDANTGFMFTSISNIILIIGILIALKCVFAIMK